jgi:flagellar biosynthetic protein FliP
VTPGPRSQTSRAMRNRLKSCRSIVVLSALSTLTLAGCTGAGSSTQGAMLQAPGVRLELGGAGAGNNPAALQFFLLLTVLSLVPAILMMVTSFVRIAIVLGFVRNAIGVPQLPPNQILLGLSLFLTLFVMAPTWQRINETAVQPYVANQVTPEAAFDLGIEPLREFMFKQVREGDLALFVQLGGLPRPNTPQDVPTHVLVPAFMISELKTAFQMGFLILVPFLVIDLVVSSVLMSMGMMMLPPATIALPFKVLLFVLADGWHLIVRSLITSFA